MTVRLEITCVTKTNGILAHERISFVGGLNGTAKWKMDIRDAIEGADALPKRWEFFVNVNGKAVDVTVALSRTGQKYLRTLYDSDQPNTLLKLPECS